MSIFDSAEKYSISRGSATPFIFVFVSVFYLFTVPLNTASLEKHEGYLINYDTVEYANYWIQENSNPFRVDMKKYKKILKNELPKAKYLEIWTKKNKYLTLQLKIDGRMVIEYHWWNHAKYPIVLILIGLITLPFIRNETIKERW